MTSRPLRLLAAALVCAAAVSACGDDASTADDPSGTPTSEAGSPSASSSESGSASTTDEPVPSATAVTGPPCADVWVAGATLPRDYRGCDLDGTWQRADKKPCSFGKPIVVFGERFYAVPGKVVNDVEDLASSEQYQSALAACQA